MVLIIHVTLSPKPCLAYSSQHDIKNVGATAHKKHLLRQYFTVVGNQAIWYMPLGGSIVPTKPETFEMPKVSWTMRQSMPDWCFRDPVAKILFARTCSLRLIVSWTRCVAPTIYLPSLPLCWNHLSRCESHTCCFQIFPVEFKFVCPS